MPTDTTPLPVEASSLRLSELLRFKPWPPPGDPVPDWDWIRSLLDKAQLTRMAQVELEFCKSILQSKVRLIEQAMDVVKAGK